MQNPFSLSKPWLFPIAGISGLVLAFAWKNLTNNAPPPGGNWFTFLALSASLVAAVTDLRTGKIYNWLTYPTALTALFLSTVASLSPAFHAWSGVQSLSPCVLGAGLALGLVCVAQQLMGGGMGDIKLAGALGALVGPALAWQILATLYVSAAVWSLCLMLLHLGPRLVLRLLLRGLACSLIPNLYLTKLEQDVAGILKRRVRLGPFFAVGVVTALTLSAVHTSATAPLTTLTNLSTRADFVSANR